MAEAGYTKAKPLVIKALVPSSGSGMMQPIPMNEFVQQSLNDVGFKVELEVLEWNALISAWRAGAKDPSSRGAVALNYSYFIQDPFTAFTRHVQSDLVAPKGTNWGYFGDKTMDGLLLKAKTSFTVDAQNKVLQEIHAAFVNDALFLNITHDVNPRAMSASVKGFIQAQNWFQDFSTNQHGQIAFVGGGPDNCAWPILCHLSLQLESRKTMPVRKTEARADPKLRHLGRAEFGRHALLRCTQGVRPQCHPFKTDVFRIDYTTQNFRFCD